MVYIGVYHWFHCVRPSARLSRIVCPLCNSWMDFSHIRHKWSLACEGVLRIMTFDLDLYLQGHSTMIFHKKTAKILYILCPLCSTYISGWILCPYWAVHNYLWSWPISARSFSHDFAKKKKLLKYGAYFCVRCIQHVQIWMDSIHIWHERVCRA